MAICFQPTADRYQRPENVLRFGCADRSCNVPLMDPGSDDARRH
jgi:hypothetical protein